VFIVGVHSRIKKQFNPLKPFEWPAPIPTRKPLFKYIDMSDSTKETLMPRVNQMLKEVVNPDAIFVNTGFIQNPHREGDIVCPCLTTSNNFVCVPFHRKMNVKEMLSLQGFPKTFKQVVSDAQMKKQIGNSMSVNVVKHILLKIDHLRKAS
jgi:DNA (cytosine-5)-methyltransferase 1